MCHRGSHYPSRYIGYANSVVGSIIANKGFIDHFATVTDPETGEPALDTMHISLWSAVWYVTQVFVQIASPVTADRWGRKFNMWLLTFFLLLVCLVSGYLVPVGKHILTADA